MSNPAEIDTILLSFAESIDNVAEWQSHLLQRMILELRQVRENCGRLFIIGNGGGAAHASHAACDFRKLARIETWSLDNMAELTAGVNDVGFAKSFSNWLKRSNLCDADAVMVISVGGGDKDAGVSPNIVDAIDWAIGVDARILAIVGPRGGYAKQKADVCITIPAPKHLETPITEGLQSVILHALVSHPTIALSKPKWESIGE
jgi:D-sedoheptulose 7-phosphate isomerase